MILVTGGTGFLGSELIRQLLLQGKSVRAIKRESSVIPEILEAAQLVEWRNADILNFDDLNEAMEGVTTVYHCAAMVSFRKADKKMMRRINIEGTANLVNICLENRIGKFLHVSSVSAVGQSKKDALISEKLHWQFDKYQSSYAISKYESEMEVFRGIAEGLNAVIVNPSIIIGKNAGESGSGQFFRKVKDGLKFYPQGSCGIVDVEDVAGIMIRLMDSNLAGERYIINAVNISYLDLFTKIAHQYNLNPPNVKLQPWMLTGGYWASNLAKLLTGEDYGLTKEIVNSASKETRYSNDKIKNALTFGFKPIDQSISEICVSADKTS